MSLPEARVWVEVDLEAIRHNARVLKTLCAPAQLAPVIKSEAYGHGMLEVAQAVLEDGELWGLCLVYPEEGIRLRQAGVDCRLLVLGPLLEFEMESAIEHRLEVAVYSFEQAEQLSAACRRLGQTIGVHLKVDTGLSRLSHTPEEAHNLVRRLMALEGLELVGIYSHLADAEGLDQTYTLHQYQRFQTLLERLETEEILPPCRHMAASAAGMLLEQTRLDMVRAGIALYGLWPAEETRLLMLGSRQNLLELVNKPFADSGEIETLDDLLHPALSFKTRILQIKWIEAGSKVGYGCTFETQRRTRIAVLPMGYAEGFDRHLSNCGEVLVRGRRARVLGRVCMNLTTVDVTDIEGVQPDDEVVLIGGQGDNYLSAAEMAAKIGTIHYEVVTRIPASVPRIYVRAETSICTPR